MPRAGAALFNRPPPTPTTPIPVLIAATIALYRRTFRPLFVTAAVIAAPLTVVNVLLLPQPDVERPETLLRWLFAEVILQAVSVGFLSVVLWRATLLRRGEASSLTGTLLMVLVLGPRCFPGGMLLGVPFFPLPGTPDRLALPVFGLTVFVWVRASLYVPAVVVENLSIVEGFVRTWRLVAGRWLRTLLLVSIVALPIIAGSFALAALLVNVTAPVMIVVDTVATGVVIPFLSVFGLLLFEDYARASAGTPGQLDDRPPTDEEPPASPPTT